MKKNNRQTVRFTEEQMNKLRAISSKQQKTISQVLREMVSKSQVSSRPPEPC